MPVPGSALNFKLIHGDSLTVRCPSGRTYRWTSRGQVRTVRTADGEYLFTQYFRQLCLR